MKNWMKLLISLLIPQLIAGAAATFTSAEIGGWYRTIQKPDWNPPNWLFAPVWTALYIMMGIALYLVWSSNKREALKRRAIVLWSIQLVLNFLWSFLFFNQHLLLGGLIDIILLWIFILFTIFSFAKINKAAAWLLVPYISWVTFAGLLNFEIWKINF